MGYDIHITRADYWAENQGREITADEWLSVVDADPTLRIDSDNGQYFAELTGSGDEAWRWLNWSEGNITTKWPDRVTLDKMLEIARHLGAHVQGDDGEPYHSADDIPDIGEEDRSAIDSADGKPKYLRREARWDWIMYALIFLAVLAVNLLDLW